MPEPYAPIIVFTGVFFTAMMWFTFIFLMGMLVYIMLIGLQSPFSHPMTERDPVWDEARAVEEVEGDKVEETPVVHEEPVRRL